jgi:PII-like signaling protein
VTAKHARQWVAPRAFVQIRRRTNVSDTTIEGVQLCFYVHLRARHDGRLLSEWLLEQARQQGIGGGSVFRATAGFGRHGVLREEQFFELADDLPVKVEFLLREDQADLLLERVRAAGIDTVYARTLASYGVLGAAKAG